MDALPNTIMSDPASFVLSASSLVQFPPAEDNFTYLGIFSRMAVTTGILSSSKAPGPREFRNDR